MSRIRTIVLGTGNIANSHAKGFLEQSAHYEVVACVDVDAARAETFATKHGIPRFATDFTQALAEHRPDFVDICTPPQFHAALSIQAMEAGCDVLCEKPICGSLAELEKVQAVEKRTGKFCASVFQFRYATSTRHVHDLLQQGRLGRPLVATCNTLWFRDANYYEVAWRGKWSNALGGPTIGHGIHAMDQLLSILGPWTEVSAFAATLDRKIEVEDVSVALIRFANGALATVINSILSPREETFLRIDCQAATVELTHHYSFTRKEWSLTPKGPMWKPLPRLPAEQLTDPALVFPTPDRPATHGTQLAHLADNIRQRTTPLSAGKAVWATMELIVSIYKSAYTKRTVEAGSIRPGDPYYEQINGGHAKAPV
jgi:predicted dehydrogenase